MRKVLLSIFTCVTLVTSAQQLANSSWEGPIGTWRDHLPFNDAIAVTESSDKVYCATNSAVFSLNKEDLVVDRLSTIDGLSDVGIGALRYNILEKALVIAYVNGNVDVIKGTEIINIPAIKNSDIIGDKGINQITFFGSLAYMSCGFGIVVLDVNKNEIKETYLIGAQSSYVHVNDVDFYNGNIYAATDNGIYWASLSSPNLSDYSSWSVLGTLPLVKYNALAAFGTKLLANRATTVYNGDTLYALQNSTWSQISQVYGLDNVDLNVIGERIFITHNGNVDVFDTAMVKKEEIFSYNNAISPFPKQALRASDGWIYIADQYYGVVRALNSWKAEFYTPNGPATPSVFDMDVSGTTIAVAAGGYTNAYLNKYSRNGAYHFKDNNWTSHYWFNNAALDTAFDIVAVAIDPAKPSRFFAASWGRGLLEFEDDKLKKVYYKGNSALEERNGSNGWVGVGGLKFDSNGHLWMTNSYHYKGLALLTTGGTWKNFSLTPYADDNTEITHIEIDDFNRIWIVEPKANRILVYDYKGTPLDENDDEIRVLTSTGGQGDLHGDKIFSIKKDLDGEMWIGSNEGVAVVYAPGNVYDGGDFDAQQILIEQDGTAQILLEAESVTSITVDGANRKWFGTEKAGAFLMTEDGLREVFHFTKSNSPLYSDAISSIAVNDENGEVFFGTDKGIISYKSTATAPQAKYDSVVVYPNPVHPGYDGLIAIKGLMGDSDVKITDAAGNVIYETLSLGGQAIWNGKAFNGRRAASGVYHVLSVSPDGRQDHVAKILFVN